MISEKDLKYLALCDVGARLFSTCAKRQYMAIVLDDFGRVSGMGYNGSAPGQPHCKDGACPRYQVGSVPGSDYDNCIAIHAEQNALMFSGLRATIYVNGTPCSTCAKLMAGSGIKRLVGIADASYPMAEGVLLMLRASGVEVLMAEYRQVIACVTE
jgi:dCMP deaminase